MFNRQVVQHQRPFFDSKDTIKQCYSIDDTFSYELSHTGTYAATWTLKNLSSRKKSHPLQYKAKSSGVLLTMNSGTHSYQIMPIKASTSIRYLNVTQKSINKSMLRRKLITIFMNHNKAQGGYPFRMSLLLDSCFSTSHQSVPMFRPLGNREGQQFLSLSFM